MPAEKPLCPTCKVPMTPRLRRELEGHNIPEEGYPMDAFKLLFTNSLYLDLYTCPQCRRVAFFEADLSLEAKARANRVPSDEPKTTPQPDPWEKGGLFRHRKDKPDWEG